MQITQKVEAKRYQSSKRIEKGDLPRSSYGKLSFMTSYQPRIALVHDDFVQRGGAENLFAEIAKIWPDGPIYTSLVDWQKLPKSIDKTRIHTSFMQKIPFKKILYKALMPIYPFAFESFSFENYDAVISSTTRFAKAIITNPHTAHICYINSVPRFLWFERAKSKYIPPYLVAITKPLFAWLKRWDKVASSRPDVFIANSENVANTVNSHYQRKAEVLYPFVDHNIFKPTINSQLLTTNFAKQNIPYFLIVSRLVKWKKIDIAIKACQALGVNLRIVGTGPDGERLKRISTTNYIKFLGTVSQDELVKLYQNAYALIVTQEEDFGLSALEAQSCGIPTIAYNKGGVPEIIKAGQSGVLFEKQTESSLKDAISKAKEVKWEAFKITANAKKFSKENFVKELTSYVERTCKTIIQTSK